MVSVDNGSQRDREVRPDVKMQNNADVFEGVNMAVGRGIQSQQEIQEGMVQEDGRQEPQPLESRDAGYREEKSSSWRWNRNLTDNAEMLGQGLQFAFALTGLNGLVHFGMAAYDGAQVLLGHADKVNYDNVGVGVGAMIVSLGCYFGAYFLQNFVDSRRGKSA